VREGEEEGVNDPTVRKNDTSSCSPPSPSAMAKASTETKTAAKSSFGVSPSSSLDKFAPSFIQKVLIERVCAGEARARGPRRAGCGYPPPPPVDRPARSPGRTETSEKGPKVGSVSAKGPASTLNTSRGGESRPSTGETEGKRELLSFSRSPRCTFQLGQRVWTCMRRIVRQAAV